MMIEYRFNLFPELLSGFGISRQPIPRTCKRRTLHSYRSTRSKFETKKSTYGSMWGNKTIFSHRSWTAAREKGIKRTTVYSKLSTNSGRFCGERGIWEIV